MNIKPVKTKADYKIALKSRVSEILNRKRKLTFEMILEQGQIFIKPILSPRKCWEKAFKEMNENGEDQLFFNEAFENENLEESR